MLHSPTQEGMGDVRTKTSYESVTLWTAAMDQRRRLNIVSRALGPSAQVRTGERRQTLEGLCKGRSPDTPTRPGPHLSAAGTASGAAGSAAPAAPVARGSRRRRRGRPGTRRSRRPRWSCRGCLGAAGGQGPRPPPTASSSSVQLYSSVSSPLTRDATCGCPVARQAPGPPRPPRSPGAPRSFRPGAPRPESSGLASGCGRRVRPRRPAGPPWPPAPLPPPLAVPRRPVPGGGAASAHSRCPGPGAAPAGSGSQVPDLPGAGTRAAGSSAPGGEGGGGGHASGYLGSPAAGEARRAREHCLRRPGQDVARTCQREALVEGKGALTAAAFTCM